MMCWKLYSIFYNTPQFWCAIITKHKFITVCNKCICVYLIKLHRWWTHEVILLSKQVEVTVVSFPFIIYSTAPRRSAMYIFHYQVHRWLQLNTNFLSLMTKRFNIPSCFDNTLPPSQSQANIVLTNPSSIQFFSTYYIQYSFLSNN